MALCAKGQYFNLNDHVFFRIIDISIFSISSKFALDIEFIEALSFTDGIVTRKQTCGKTCIYPIDLNIFSNSVIVPIFKVTQLESYLNIFYFDIHTWETICRTLNIEHKHIYKLIRIILRRKLMYDAECIILDFLNIPYNYDWLYALFKHMEIRWEPTLEADQLEWR